MKNIKILLWSIGLLTITSCTDWLTVTPRTEVPKAELYETQDGFRDALEGVYIQLKNENGYGGRLSYGDIECYAMAWACPATTSLNYYLSTFNFSNETSRDAVSAAYNALYKSITYANDILDVIDRKEEDGVFKTRGMYELVKGECLAIRAMCHLDVLRMFGPVPAADMDTETPILVYMEKVTHKDVPHISYNAFKEKILADLQAAEEILAPVDPLVAGNPAMEGLYFSKRTAKLNYYAVKALQARANLWFMNKTAAYDCAKTVIDAVSGTGQRLFPLQTLGYGDRNYVLTREHIFSLHMDNLFTIWNTRFATPSGYSRGSYTNSNTVLNSLYGGTEPGDFRRTVLWDRYDLPGSTDGAANLILKKYHTLLITKNPEWSVEYRRIPILRTSEMYLIAFECAPNATDRAAIWREFMLSRTRIDTTAPGTDDYSQKISIAREYRREFVGEGQTFYALKRLNAENNIFYYPWPVAERIALKYAIPLPDSETPPAL